MTSIVFFREMREGNSFATGLGNDKFHRPHGDTFC